VVISEWDQWLTFHFYMKRSKIILTIIVLAGLTIAYFFLPDKVISPVKSLVSTITSPLEKVLSSSSQGIRNKLSGITHIKDLRNENNELMAEVARLRKENSDLKEVKAENELYKKEFAARNGVLNSKLLEAKVIGRQPSSFLQSFTIDQGTNSGIKVGQAATSQGMLVGRVTEAGANTSEVTLVLSSRSIVQAALQNTRTFGIVKGGLQGLYLDNIPQEEPFTAGETVVTSGLGGDMPAGIIIGNVDKVTTPKSEIFQTFSLTTPLNFNKISTVFVVIQ
jgi:rod shape-determining protein MreC